MKISQGLIDAAVRNKMSTVQKMVDRLSAGDTLTMLSALDNILLALYRKIDTPVINDKVKVLDEGSDYHKQVGTVVMWIRTNMTGDKALILVVEFADKKQVQFYPVQVTTDINSMHVRVN